MAHFHSFTADGMRRFGEDLARSRERRADDNRKNRSAMLAGLADYRKRADASSRDRRKRAADEADARRLFMSELRSGVHAFLNRCGLSRAEMAADHRTMAGELAAAKEAFRNRPR